MTTSKTQRDRESIPTFLQGTVPGGGLNITLGIQLAFSWVVLIGGGVWLDRRQGGGWTFTFLGLLLGLAFLAYELWKIVRKVPAPPPPRTDSGNPTQTEGFR
jgi:hypothetical protein